jgi:DNA-binding NarL/FixJ family response regulator
MAKSPMKHLSILPMLVRCALVNANDAMRQQVQRLCEALDDDGLKAIADKVRESLNGPNDEKILQQLINATAEGSPRRRRLEAALDAYRGLRFPALAPSGVRRPVVKRTIDALPSAQRRVLFAVNQGFSDGRIAEELDRSINTVRNHVKVLFKKFEVRSRAELIAKTAIYHQ